MNVNTIFSFKKKSLAPVTAKKTHHNWHHDLNAFSIPFSCWPAQNEVWSTALPHHLLQSKGQEEDSSQGNGGFHFPEQHNSIRPFLLKMDVAETITIITMLFRYAGIKPEPPQYSVHNS